MKKLLLLLSLSLFTLFTHAQKRKDITESINISGTLKADYEEFPAGSDVTLMQVSKLKNRQDPVSNGMVLVAAINGQQVAMPTRQADYLDLKPQDTEEFWNWMFIKNQMYDYYEKKGYKNKLRKEITDEADELLQETNNAYYQDDHVQDYIRTIFIGIVPQKLNNNKRPEVPNIEILNSPAPDCYMYPNGTLMITTGLLSALDSVEELTALIACEVAHYVFDHHLVNVAKEVSRARKAEFWAPIIQGLAYTTEVILTEKNEHYVPGGIFLAGGIAIATISSDISYRLGMSYTKAQVKQADRTAIEFLQFAGMDPYALASALTKIRAYYHTENDLMALSSGDLRDLDARIEYAATNREPKEFGNRFYQKNVSGVTTINAVMHQNRKNFLAAERLANKNIQNDLASVDDYVISIKSNMNRTNSPEANEENLQLISQVKKMTLVPNPNLHKLEILLLLRMDREGEACSSLKEYVEMLQELQSHTNSGEEFDWAASEIFWANNLYQRVNRI